MALFFRDDASYNEGVRLSGFDRYRQLMSFYAARWIKVNLLTVLGALPLAFGIMQAILNSSLLVLLPVSIVGGMIFGPFLAAMYDSIMRGLRDAPGTWREHYRRSWKQNLKGSLFSGAVLGFMIGIFAFMLYILWSAQTSPDGWTVALYLLSAALLLLLNTLYWPQLVLFRQTTVNRLKNAALFTIKHFKRVVLSVVLQLVYLLIYVLFAPWTLLLIPLVGFWYILFVSQLLIYDDLDMELNIEEQFAALEGDPWRGAGDHGGDGQA